jgi:phosphonate transport system permease protein
MNTFALDVETYSKQNLKKIIKKFLFYISLVAIIFFSVYFIIILDTDWHRIGSGESILKQLSYFVGLDLSLVKYLIVPTFETFLMACLGTMLGLFLSLPVAWLGARNVTPLGVFSFGFASSSAM